MSKITQREFIEQYAVRCGVTETRAAEYIDVFKKLVYELLRGGNSVKLLGFGQFLVSHRDARIGINPRTLTRITIPELNIPKFRAGEAFKAAVKLHQ